MFILSFRNEGGGGYAEADTFTATTDPEQLRLAEKLQELIWRIGNVRLPIADVKFYHGEEERCILIRIPGIPKTGWPPPARIFMTELNKAHANPPKQIQIFAEPSHLEKAVSLFTETAFGIPLAKLNDPNFVWPMRSVVAVPGDFNAITILFSGVIEKTAIQYIDFQNVPLDYVAKYLPVLCGHPVLVSEVAHGAITYCIVPGMSPKQALDGLIEQMKTNQVYTSQGIPGYLRLVHTLQSANPPAPAHIEIQIEKDQLFVNGQLDLLENLNSIFSKQTNTEYEVWVYDAENSTHLNFAYIREQIHKSGAPLRSVFREYLPKP